MKNQRVKSESLAGGPAADSHIDGWSTEEWSIVEATKKDEKNWNFESVPKDDVHCCLIWEYARQSPFLRDLYLRDVRKDEYSALSIQDLQRLLVFGGAAGIDFPNRPWRDLPANQRKFVRTQLLRAEVHEYPMLELLEKAVQRQRSLHPKVADDSLFIQVPETAWDRFSKNEILRQIDIYLELRRPKNMPGPTRQGELKKTKFVYLRWLSAMRLKAAMGFTKAVEAMNSISDLAEWQDRAYWGTIRSKAKKKLRELFPFLPEGEEERAFPTIV